MRKIFFNIITSAGILALVIFASSCSKQSSNPAPVTVTPTPDPTPKTYSLVWSDEFNGTAVDATKWGFETGNIHVNHELEYYQASNATVSGGNLIITARKESVGGQPYTSARMNTMGKMAITYGRIESRIKLPLGAGLWPAFWMLGDNINTVSWPQCGEIDIMEHVNANNLNYGTMHWNNNGHVSYGLTTTTTPDQFHVYAIEWDNSSIKWFVDDNLYATGNIQINNTNAFHLPFFVILNMAVGGDFPGNTIDESLLPASMYVDYVRVYQLK